jgi:uncharacterized protein YqcC (DUF446 family)
MNRLTSLVLFSLKAEFHRTGVFFPSLLLILHHDLPSHFAINPYFVIAVYRKTAIDLPLFFF